MTLTDFLLARIAEDEAHLDRVIADLAAVDSRFPHFATQLRTGCEAKRRIVQQFVEGDTDDLWGPEIGALLAMPYADHPDYRPEWAPQHADS